MKVALWTGMGLAAVAGAALWPANPGWAQGQKPAQSVPAVDFKRDIQPMLVRTCSGCHGPTKSSAGFRVDSLAALLQGGRSGPAVVPGKSGRSLLVMKSDEDDPTPHKGRVLDASQLVLLKAWVDQGARASAAGSAVVDVDLSTLPPDLVQQLLKAGIKPGKQ